MSNVTKKIIIRACIFCPRKRTFSDTCGMKNRAIANIHSIPEWCPLEDN